LTVSYSRLLLSFGFGEAVALRLHPSPEVSQFQWRYMLPGVVFLCVRLAVGRTTVPRVVYAVSA
jgi:hypothetical protein